MAGSSGRPDRHGRRAGRRAGRRLRGRGPAPRPGQYAYASRADRHGRSAARTPEFAAWIRRLREAKGARPLEAFLAAARRGLVDCWSAGVTTVADTGDSGAVVQALAEAGGSGIAYQEVFGPHPDQCDASLLGLQRQVERLGRYAGGRVGLGVSPHAPYTVSGPLYAATAAWARAEGLPVAVHLAESPAESRCSPPARARSPTRGGLAASRCPRPPAGRRSSGSTSTACSPPGRSAFTWCRPRPPTSSGWRARMPPIAHCPLSNRAHGHGAAPLRALRAARLRVGLGTDSVLSVGTLDLLAEARAARALAGLDAVATLELCTLDGARALGLETEIGSLVPGKWGDVIVVRLRGPTTPARTRVRRGARARGRG